MNDLKIGTSLDFLIVLILTVRLNVTIIWVTIHTMHKLLAAL